MVCGRIQKLVESLSFTLAADVLSLSYVQERGSGYGLCVAALVQPGGKRALIRQHGTGE